MSAKARLLVAMISRNRQTSRCTLLFVNTFLPNLVWLQFGSVTRVVCVHCSIKKRSTTLSSALQQALCLFHLCRLRARPTSITHGFSYENTCSCICHVQAGLLHCHSGGPFINAVLDSLQSVMIATCPILQLPKFSRVTSYLYDSGSSLSCATCP